MRCANYGLFFGLVVLAVVYRTVSQLFTWVLLCFDDFSFHPRWSNGECVKRFDDLSFCFFLGGFSSLLLSAHTIKQSVLSFLFFVFLGGFAGLMLYVHTPFYKLFFCFWSGVWTATFTTAVVLNTVRSPCCTSPRPPPPFFFFFAWQYLSSSSWQKAFSVTTTFCVVQCCLHL